MKRYSVTVNGNVYDVVVEEVAADASAPVAPVAAPVAAPVKAAPAAAPAAPVNATGTKVNAPMPGTVLKMKVNVGDAVKRGDVVCVLEAMKMENEITAPVDGKVSFAAAQGTSVKTGDLLVSIG
ncbi:MAG: acetyl-CoA carboxylase biotin carboxyl carrier protein subunit [Clostridia bacterium]|nr:acetyl-CoA carboxylase biotin carboxyl carrier protein subunit [Clostridia bacterium]